MSAFIEFYEEKQSITESLIESCSDPKVADDAFDVLAAAEQFLDMLLWKEGASFIKFMIQPWRNPTSGGKVIPTENYSFPKLSVRLRGVKLAKRRCFLMKLRNFKPHLPQSPMKSRGNSCAI